MKLKFTIVLFFVALGLFAQKQLQPYNYSITPKDKSSTETATIMIYASAEAVNSITFTLKNAKNEVLKNEDNEDIIFKVFPFTETSFRKFLSDAINNQTDTELDVFKTRLKTLNTDVSVKGNTNQVVERKNTVLEIRNIFQFFEALVITAFQYDNEPVAGLLKYRDTVKISKKTIEGLDTDIYFDRQAKFIRNIIFDSKDYNLLKDNEVKPVLDGKYSEIPIDGFIRFLSKPLDYKITVNQSNKTLIVYRTSYLWRLLEFHQNSKKGNNRGSRSLLKKHIRKQLNDWYNIYQLSLFTKEDWIKKYFENKTHKNDLENEINTLKNEAITKISEEIKDIETKIDSISIYTDRINYEINYYSDYIDWDLEGIESIEYSDNIRKQEQEKYGKKLVSTRDSLASNLKKNKREIIELNDEKIKINDTTIPNLNKERSQIQNNINFLIANNKIVIAKIPLWKFTVENIEIDFNDGFIEHIVVNGKINEPKIDEISLLRSIDSESQNRYSNTDLKKMIKDFYREPFVKEIYKDIFEVELKFENEYPIGFSSKTDFADLDNYYLYSFKGAERIYSLRLTEIINLYIQRHQNDRLDFSPKDQVVRLPLDDLDKNNEIELKKEKSSKILNAKIFTDFNGLKENKPNGLVQIEVEKQIPLWTKRMDLGLGRSSNVGFANYAIFNLTWAKLNEEDRELQVNYAESFANNQQQIDKYITYLDLIKYENVSVGVDLNIASFDFPLVKTRLELNAGAHYGRIKVVDTLTNDQGAPLTSKLDKDVNMVRLYPDIILRIRPEERFGGYLRYRPFRTIVPNTDDAFFAISSSEDFEEDRTLSKDWLQRFELGAFYTPSADSDNKFFFRYRYTNTSEWETNGYSEIQLGYQIYLKF